MELISDVHGLRVPVLPLPIFGSDGKLGQGITGANSNPTRLQERWYAGFGDCGSWFGELRKTIS